MTVQSDIFQTCIWELHAHDIGDAVFGAFHNTRLERSEQLGPRDRRWGRTQSFDQFLRQICDHCPDFQTFHITGVLHPALCIGKVAPPTGVTDGHQANFIA